MRMLSAIILGILIGVVLRVPNSVEAAETIVAPTIALGDKSMPPDVTITTPSAAATAAAQAAQAASQTVLYQQLSSIVLSGIAIGLYFLQQRNAATAQKVKDNATKAVATAHWVVQQMKNMGLIKPGLFANVEDEFFKLFNERFNLDYGHAPDGQTENVAYGILTQHYNAATPAAQLQAPAPPNR